MAYEYQEYIDIYNKLGGVTTHFMPVIGVRDWTKYLLSQEQFADKLNRLLELDKTEPAGADEAESQAWEGFDIRSDLFLCEKLHPHYNDYNNLD